MDCLRGRLGLFCHFRFRGVEGFDEVDGAGCSFYVSGQFRTEFASCIAFGLEATEFGERAHDDPVGLGAGTVDIVLAMAEVVVRHGVGIRGVLEEGGFDGDAALESPGGADDFR